MLEQHDPEPIERCRGGIQDKRRVRPLGEQLKAQLRFRLENAMTSSI
jgi:hypothetical protein